MTADTEGMIESEDQDQGQNLIITVEEDMIHILVIEVTVEIEGTKEIRRTRSTRKIRNQKKRKRD